MKSFTADKQGDLEVLNLHESEIPSISEFEVLIKTYFFSLNPVDYKIISTDRFGIKFPFTPGIDVSGVIEKVGASVKSLKIGDEILAKLPISKSGGFAEFAVAPENLVILKKTIPFEQAAAIPLASLTAWQALFDHGALSKGQKVLILGGSGGVGLFAIQFAHLAGAYVTTTSSAKNIDYLKNLGADEVIDYSKQKFYELVKDQDLVFDTVGNEESIHHATDVLRPGGKSISITQPSKSTRVDSGEVSAEHFMTKDDGTQLQHIVDLVESKKVKVEIAQVFDLADTMKAITLLKAGHVRGKLVVQV